MAEKKKTPNLISLNNSKKTAVVELTEKEIEIKNKLLEIEKKIISMDNILDDIENTDKESIYNSDVFTGVISAIALTAASNVVAEYFDISPENIQNLFV